MMLIETSAANSLNYFTFSLGSDANGNITDYLQFQVSNFAFQVSTVAHFEYSPFGQVTFQSGEMADSFAFRYSSKYYMPELNMNDFGMRWYSPEVGRFINRDPIEESGGTLLYGYCGNEPVGRIDVLGESDADVAEILRITDEAESELTKQGHRITPGPLNNLMIDAWKWFGLTSGSNYYDCVTQAQYLIGKLNEKKNSFDDKWEFSLTAIWPIPLHTWVSGRSELCTDPWLELDIWLPETYVISGDPVHYSGEQP